jgi:transposase
MVEEITEASLSFRRNRTAVTEAIRLAGWRIYVTNMPSEAMTLEQSVRYYREEWVVERGFHRFKEGSLPALPIYLHLPERIRGFMMLLSVALQVITLIEFVARKNLAASQEPIAGLVPGNPKMKTMRPTTERLLATFKGLHLIVQKTSESIKLTLVEELKPIHEHILTLLEIPRDIYAFYAEAPIIKDTT